MMRTRTRQAHRRGNSVLVAFLALIVLGMLSYVLLRRLATMGPTTPPAKAPVPTLGPTTVPAPVNPNQIVPGKQIGPVTLGMTQEEVKTALGAPDQTSNKMWSWKDPQMSVGWGPDGKVIVILAGGVGATWNNVPFRTPEGIAIGAAADQIIEAWGTPDSDTTEKAALSVSRQVRYNARGIHLLFSDGKLTWLSVRNPPASTQPTR
jgi:hypothetical protein